MSHILIISPDYASHYYPLSAVGRSLLERNHTVTVASGPAMGDQVKSDGFAHVEISLGPGSNPGLFRVSDQTPEEQEQLESFFETTRQGMIPTLLHQARNRLRDLLWEPERVSAELGAILDYTAPDAILVDHLAFGATATLRGLGQSFLSFHPGHPSAVPVGYPYGYPPRIPQRIQYDPAGLEELRKVSDEVVLRFSNEYLSAMRKIDNDIAPIGNPFSALSPQGMIVNYPASLGVAYGLPLGTTFIGSSVRGVRVGAQAAPLSNTRKRPRIYVSLGSFFSGRTDLLRKIVTALRSEPVEVVMSTGTSDPADLGEIPDGWTIAPYLPQPEILAQCDLVITHGGNNTVTESLTAGLPMAVAPISTDQFAAAADIEQAGLGRAFDPNNDSYDTIGDIAHDVLAGTAVQRAAALGATLRARPGQKIAAEMIETSLVRTGSSLSPT